MQFNLHIRVRVATGMITHTKKVVIITVQRGDFDVARTQLPDRRQILVLHRNQRGSSIPTITTGANSLLFYRKNRRRIRASPLLNRCLQKSRQNERLFSFIRLSSVLWILAPARRRRLFQIVNALRKLSSRAEQLVVALLQHVDGWLGAQAWTQTRAVLEQRMINCWQRTTVVVRVGWDLERVDVQEVQRVQGVAVATVLVYLLGVWSWLFSQGWAGKEGTFAVFRDATMKVEFTAVAIIFGAFLLE